MASIIGVAELSTEVRDRAEMPVVANALAINDACRDADLDPNQLDVVLTYDSIVRPDIMQAGRVADYLGISPASAATIGAVGATPAFGVALAKQMIASGEARHVAFAHSDLRARAGSAVVQRQMASIAGNPEYEAPFGTMIPAFYAFLADWLISSGRAQREDLATIAVQVRDWATMNPRARMRTPLTLMEVLDAPPVAGPLGRFDCCLITDFAGAVIVSADDDRDRSVAITASHGGAHHEELLQTDPDAPLEPVEVLAAELFRRAGITAEDIDLALLYDSFTITVALQLLGYGLDLGRGLSDLLASPGVGRGGRLAVNTHGGMLSASTSGLFHIVEAVVQLRHEAGDRQVPNAKTALVTNVGGVFSNHAALILRGAGHD